MGRTKCFPVNITKFLRTPFSQNTSGECFCFSNNCNGAITDFGQCPEYALALLL